MTERRVILEPQQFDKWLDPEVDEGDWINAMLKPGPPDWLESGEASTLVNEPTNKRDGGTGTADNLTRGFQRTA